LFLKDLNADGNEELLCSSEKYFTVYDHELNLLAKFPVYSGGHYISFRENGPAQTIEIGLHYENNYVRLSLIKNYLHVLFPTMFITSIILMYVLFCVLLNLTISLNIHSNFFSYIFRNTSAGIVIVNKRGMILYVNDQIRKVLKTDDLAENGKYIGDVFSRIPQIVEMINRALKSGKPERKTITFRDKVITSDIDIEIHPFCGFGGVKSAYLLKLENAEFSSQSEKLLVWSKAVQKMAHDIKTPLSTVSLNLKVLQMRLGRMALSDHESVELSDDIKMMQSELDHIHVMTKNFLKFSNLEKPHYQAVDIKKIIEKALEQYRPFPREDLDISTEIDADVKQAWADPQQIEMVFHILLENALFAMKCKGFISISVNMAQFLERSFSEYIEVEVADTGPGINEEVKIKIFEPYYTTKKVGTGLGLAIARKIIEDHGCSIDVHSKPNLGAVFRFSLPAMSEEVEHE
jgi:nitrogen fixation/metabolism regulation signal transduction histidine kinase